MSMNDDVALDVDSPFYTAVAGWNKCEESLEFVREQLKHLAKRRSHVTKDEMWAELAAILRRIT